MISPWVVLAAGLIEGGVGRPARWIQPATAPIWLMTRMQRSWDRPDRPQRLLGILAVVLMAGAAMLLGGAIQGLAGSLAPLVVAIVGAFGLSGRSLYDQASAVARSLAADDLSAARQRLSLMTGREAGRLGARGICAASLERLARGLNDGLIAPVFWFLIGGLPGLFAYQAVNLAAGVVSQGEDGVRLFGWAAVRTHDLMTLIPSRIAAGLIAAGAGRGWRAISGSAAQPGAPPDRWPRAAMAGALGVRLGDGLGDGQAPSHEDLNRGLHLYLRACALMAIVLVAGGLVWSFL